MLRAASASTTDGLTPSARKDCWDKFYSLIWWIETERLDHRRRNERLNLTAGTMPGLHAE